ncbi:helix-turn-helix transcriptional regulator [Algicola sagamiensis]|uniref:helix-turn-helix transcriptional regulator n=1 Tax=Algicola sagamiensis TaxID=163869 RepID=UPI00036D1CF1|nr:LuxR C-terminal-related transcriptional regulator [Algicola sagamiensis]
MPLKKIYILTTNSTQTSQETALIETLGYPICVEPFESIFVPDDAILTIIDLHGCSELPEGLFTFAKGSFQRFPIMLMNAEINRVDEVRVLLGGIGGVLYQRDMPELKIKGIRKLLEGELWYGRETLSESLKYLISQVGIRGEVINEHNHDTSVVERLTKREKMIIHLMSTGAKNKEIAHQLNISTHTVKTHIYSAFRKTNSRNRVELVSWAQRNCLT